MRAGLDILREGGVKILHYTHTRIAYYPNGTEQACCECCEPLSYVESRIENATMNFPADGIFNDNVVANGAWSDYYGAITSTARKKNVDTPVAFNPNCAHAHSEPCSPDCMTYGHTAHQCAHCTSDRCSNMPLSFWDLADVHLLSEGTAGVRPPDFVTAFPYPLTDALKSKMSMFTYNATSSQWKGFIDDARAKGFSKFWVSEAAPGGNTTSFLSLPQWFDEMVDYIAAMNE